MKWLFAALLGGALIVGSVGFVVDRQQASPATSADGPFRGSEPPGRFELPRFSLIDHNGRRVASDDLRGRVLVLTFLDSQCTETCPILASQIAQAVDALRRTERRAVVALAISTDPAEDTPASVRAFLGNHRALGKLFYLTGPERAMRRLWKRFQILASLETGEDAVHSAPVRVYDRRSIWVATLHAGVDLTPENLVHDVRIALELDR